MVCHCHIKVYVIVTGIASASTGRVTAGINEMETDPATVNAFLIIALLNLFNFQDDEHCNSDPKITKVVNRLSMTDVIR